MEKKQSLIQKFYSDDFKITAKSKWYAIAPLTLILIGVLVIAIWNFNLGLDFTGGRIINVRGFTDFNAAEAQVRTILDDVEGMNMRAVAIQREESLELGTTMSIRFQYITGANMDQVSAQIETAIRATVTGSIVEPAETITASASRDRIMNTVYAVIAAMFGILIYMFFRFRITSGVATVIGLAHDVLVMMALTAIFQIQINAPFIAALITVIGYSINNTLILFDKVRTHEKHNDARLTPEQIVDKSVKETFARTMNTTITTLVPVFALVILAGPFGVPLIREFAIPIMFGLIAGTFSTIFVVTSLYVRFEKHRIRKQRFLASKNASNTSTTKT